MDGCYMGTCQSRSTASATMYCCFVRHNEAIGRPVVASSSCKHRDGISSCVSVCQLTGNSNWHRIYHRLLIYRRRFWLSCTGLRRQSEFVCEALSYHNSRSLCFFERADKVLPRPHIWDAPLKLPYGSLRHQCSYARYQGR